MTVIRHEDSVNGRLASLWGRAAGMMTVANYVAQGLGFVSTMFLTFFLSLHDFGHYAVSVASASQSATP